MTRLSALTETEEEQKKRLAEICGKVIDIDEGGSEGWHRPNAEGAAKCEINITLVVIENYG